MSDPIVRTTHFDGVPIHLEVDVGGSRSGIGKDGKPWMMTHQNAYGFIPMTEGKDGEEVDVYLGEEPLQCEQVYCIKQLKLDGKFDENKWMVGFPDEESAVDAYVLHMPHELFGGVDQKKTPEQFKKLVMDRKIAVNRMKRTSTMSIIRAEDLLANEDELTELEEVVDQHAANEDHIREELGDRAVEVADMIDEFTGKNATHKDELENPVRQKPDYTEQEFKAEDKKTAQGEDEFGQLDTGDVHEGMYVEIDPTYGGGKGEVVEVAPSEAFVGVKMRDGAVQYHHVSNLRETDSLDSESEDEDMNMGSKTAADEDEVLWEGVDDPRKELIEMVEEGYRIVGPWDVEDPHATTQVAIGKSGDRYGLHSPEGGGIADVQWADDAAHAVDMLAEVTGDSYAKIFNHNQTHLGHPGGSEFKAPTEGSKTASEHAEGYWPKIDREMASELRLTEPPTKGKEVWTPNGNAMVLMVDEGTDAVTVQLDASGEVRMYTTDRLRKKEAAITTANEALDVLAEFANQAEHDGDDPFIADEIRDNIRVVKGGHETVEALLKQLETYHEGLNEKWQGKLTAAIEKARSFVTEASKKTANSFSEGDTVALKPEFGKRGIILYRTPYQDFMVAWSGGGMQRVNPDLLMKVSKLLVKGADSLLKKYADRIEEAKRVREPQVGALDDNIILEVMSRTDFATPEDGIRSAFERVYDKDATDEDVSRIMQRMDQRGMTPQLEARYQRAASKKTAQGDQMQITIVGDPEELEQLLDNMMDDDEPTPGEAGAAGMGMVPNDVIDPGLPDVEDVGEELVTDEDELARVFDEDEDEEVEAAYASKQAVKTAAKKEGEAFVEVVMPDTYDEQECPPSMDELATQVRPMEDQNKELADQVADHRQNEHDLQLALDDLAGGVSTMQEKMNPGPVRPPQTMIVQEVGIGAPNLALTASKKTAASLTFEFADPTLAKKFADKANDMLNGSETGFANYWQNTSTLGGLSINELDIFRDEAKKMGGEEIQVIAKRKGANVFGREAGVDDDLKATDVGDSDAEKDFKEDKKEQDLDYGGSTLEETEERKEGARPLDKTAAGTLGTAVMDLKKAFPGWRAVPDPSDVGQGLSIIMMSPDSDEDPAHDSETMPDGMKEQIERLLPGASMSWDGAYPASLSIQVKVDPASFEADPNLAAIQGFGSKQAALTEEERGRLDQLLTWDKDPKYDLEDNDYLELQDLLRKKREAFVKTAPPANVKDKAKWEKAKDAAQKSNPDDLYALTNHIYQNMGGSFGMLIEAKGPPPIPPAARWKREKAPWENGKMEEDPLEETLDPLTKEDEEKAHEMLMKSFNKKVVAYVRKTDGGWGVYSESGKLLGKHDSKQDANKQLKAIEVNKKGMKLAIFPKMARSYQLSDEESAEAFAGDVEAAFPAGNVEVMVEGIVVVVDADEDLSYEELMLPIVSDHQAVDQGAVYEEPEYLEGDSTGTSTNPFGVATAVKGGQDPYAHYYEHVAEAEKHIKSAERLYRAMTRARKEESPYDTDLKEAIKFASDAAGRVVKARKLYSAFATPGDRSGSYKYSKARRKMQELDTKLGTLRGRLVRSFGVSDSKLAHISEVEDIFDEVVNG